MRTRDLIQRLAPSVDFHQDRYARALQEHLQLRCKWLDIGAGSRLHDGDEAGPLSPPALSASAALLVGTDRVIKHLRDNCLLTFAVAADIEQLPFPGCAFDLVTANMVLEHLARPTVVLREVWRVLRPGGRFIAVTPNLHHPVVYCSSALLGADRRRHLANQVEGRPLEHVFPTFYRANTLGCLRCLARDCGFGVERIESFTSIPFSHDQVSVMILECCFIRLTSVEWLQELRSNLILVFQRPCVQ